MPGNFRSTVWSGVVLILALVGRTVAAGYVPEFRVLPDDYTVMMAVDAARSEELKADHPGGHGKFFVTAWKRAEQFAEWEMTVPAKDDYAVNVLLRRVTGSALRLEVMAGEKRVNGVLPATVAGWQRQALDGVVQLPKGRVKMALRLMPVVGTGGFEAEVFSVELVRPSVRERLHRAALAMRTDTTWLQQAKYGIMVHWTSQSCPRHGERKPYAEAVRNFNVEAFADQMQTGGAGFVVLTTSHAFHYFPAPIEAVDKLLPGRTSRRDLVGDLADALNRRGIRLLLYYHLGASSDPQWLEATGFWETDATRFFNNWRNIVSEVGRRYGSKLAGWWFDDGAISYYYRSAPWQQLTEAARAGNPQRLVGYNPWILPSPTEFQDYFCGEGFENPAGEGTLVVGDDGHCPGGLQACATLITESDWGHFQADREIGPPRWTAAEFADKMKQFATHRNVPIFDLEIYQEGTVSPATIEIFKQARSLWAESK